MIIEINAKEKYRIMDSKQKEDFLSRVLTIAGIYSDSLPDAERDKLFTLIAGYCEKYFPKKATEILNAKADEILRRERICHIGR